MMKPALTVVCGVLLQLLLLFVMTGCSPSDRSDAPPPGRPAPPKTSHFLRNRNQDKLIVFIHGIFGDADSTWYNDQSKTSWFDLLINDHPDFDSYDVLTVSYFSPYAGAASSIVDIASRVKQTELLDRKLFSQYKAICFITHSMGGLIAKRIINSMNNSNEVRNLGTIKAVLFIATPAQGSDLAALASWVKVNPQLRGMNPDGARDFLRSLDSDFRKVLGARTARAPFPRSYCAFETQATIKLNIVPALYAESQCDQDPLALDFNHIDIVKPYSREHQPYVWAKARILEAAALQEQTSGMDMTKTPKATDIATGHIVLFEGFRDFERSGFNFSTASVVGWGSGKADILVSNHQPPELQADLFVQNETGRYSGASQDKGANGGIVRVQQPKLEAVVECPVSGYETHWVKTDVDGVYCVRTRDGQHYGKIRVTNVESDRIAFDWMYQPAVSRRFD